MKLTKKQLELNTELIELAIKIMQATEVDKERIKSAISLHSEIKLSLI